MENYHLVKKDGIWKLKKEKSERSVKNFETKQEALKYAQDFMQNHGGSLRIHKEDGKFQEERTYTKKTKTKAKKTSSKKKKSTKKKK